VHVTAPVVVSHPHVVVIVVLLAAMAAARSARRAGFRVRQ
jgi:hypothetical protein